MCPVYADLREGLDPELRLEDRASYPRKVVLRHYREIGVAPDGGT